MPRGIYKRKKRILSAETRAKISQANKARWAAKRIQTRTPVQDAQSVQDVTYEPNEPPQRRETDFPTFVFEKGYNRGYNEGMKDMKKFVELLLKGNTNGMPKL